MQRMRAPVSLKRRMIVSSEASGKSTCRSRRPASSEATEHLTDLSEGNTDPRASISERDLRDSALLAHVDRVRRERTGGRLMKKPGLGRAPLVVRPGQPVTTTTIGLRTAGVGVTGPGLPRLVVRAIRGDPPSSRCS